MLEVKVAIAPLFYEISALKAVLLLSNMNSNDR